MKTNRFLLAVAVATMAFTFSCSSDDGEEKGGGGSGSFTDSRNGTKYKTVKIGTQTWMAENLNYEVGGSKCYNDNPANCTKYGRLYDWTTATTICPSGWHLPTNADWETLVNNDAGGAGKHLKSLEGWEDQHHGSLDTYGFKALPGGYGFPGINNILNFPNIESLLALAGLQSLETIEDFLYIISLLGLAGYIGLEDIPPTTPITDIEKLRNGFFDEAGYYGFWWTASEYDTISAYYSAMMHHDNGVGLFEMPKFLLFSVRCVKN